MSRGTNQKIRILYLWRILSERTDEEHGMTLEELTTALAEYGVEAERKTLYDDLETLRLFGLDVEKRRDKTVRYHMISRTFELPELKLLVDAVQASKFITHRKSNELIRKIESLTSRHEASKLQRQVFVANRIKTMNESIYYAVDCIHEAIHSNRKVSFGYFNWNEKKEKQLRRDGARYVVSPWALTWDDENYYMIAYEAAADKVKHYRVDKMTALEVEETPREGATYFENFDMAVYSKQTFGMFGGREGSVCLRCDNRLAGVVIDRFGADIPFHNVSDTHFEVRVHVHISPLFFAWVMNFGADMQIVSPSSVKEEFLQHLDEIAARYRE